MRLVPKDKAGKIQFCKTRVSRWAEDPGALGLSVDDVNELAALTEAAEQALRDQQQAQQTARAATMKLRQSLAEMQNQAARMISRIRGTVGDQGGHQGGDQGGDRGIYPLALIPAPAKRSTIGPPGKPYAFDARFDAIGTLTLTWKCRHPRGSRSVLYHLRRQIDDGAMTYLGGCPDKSFADHTLPAGAKLVRYQVQAARSTGEGPVASFTLQLGKTGNEPISMQTRRIILGPPGMKRAG